MYADLCKLLGEKASLWSEKYLQVLELPNGPAGAGWYFNVTGGEAWVGAFPSAVLATNEGRRRP